MAFLNVRSSNTTDRRALVYQSSCNPLPERRSRDRSLLLRSFIQITPTEGGKRLLPTKATAVDLLAPKVVR